MDTKIFEEDSKQGKPPIGDQAKGIEKQARQLAYDIRYEIKKATGDKKLDPAALKREYLKGLQKSSQPPAVKLRAKQMLMGEDYISDVKNIVSENVANALYKVFVEGVDNTPEIELDYLKELADTKETKYKVRVTDRKTGNSYVRYATREKISELRANPNISSVEMTEHGEPRDSEKNKGAETAAVKSGKAKKDYDGDGKVESGAKEYRGAVHNAIQRRKGGVADGKDTSSVKEDFIGEVKTTEEKKNKKVTGEGVNNSSIVKVFPDDKTAPSRHGMVVANSYEMGGAVITEKAVSQAQQKFMGMVYAAKKGGKAASPEVAKAAKGMSEKEARKFAKTKHEGLPVHKEAAECGSEEDPRQMKTKKDKVRTALGLMGIKASYEPEGKMVDEATAAARRGLSDTHRPGREERASAAAKSLAGKKKRQEVLDTHEKKTGTKLDISRSREGKEHSKNFPGSRQEPKERGAKETSSETQNRRASRHNERVMKSGFTKKEKAEDTARRPYDSARD